MRYEEAFPSNFLKASDLKDKPVTVTIKNYGMEEMKDGKKKPTLELKSSTGTEKKLVLNVTNAKKIAAILKSPEMDDWIGKKIVLYPTIVEFAGDEVEAIRVRAAAVIMKPAIVKPEPEETEDPHGGEDPHDGLADMNDEIPF